jgi:hypothetical protein
MNRTLQALGLTVWATLLAIAAGTAVATQAPPEPSAICDDVALRASQATGVPLAVLQAISLTETGRRRDGAFRPWPWTVNMEGKGVWFDSLDEARAYVGKEHDRGARSFDVGCFQINYKWHGHEFASIDAMFDPMTNALYAAQLLGTLYAETGSWSAAAGSYHSRTPKFANRYRDRFDRILARLTGGEVPAAPEGAPGGGDIPEIPDIVLAANGGDTPADPPLPRVNRFPLLRAGGQSALASLVPLDQTGGGSLFADPEG